MDIRDVLGRWTVVGLAAIQFLIHLATNGNYGIFRDELYYIDCARHLAWGYVDQPPLSIALLAGWMQLFGDALGSIRILPALAGSGLVLLAAAIAREAGGGRFAGILAGLAAFLSPHYLAVGGFYSMNAFDLLVWAGAILLVMRLLHGGDPRSWIWLGLVLGLGLLNKISVLVLGFALLVGLVTTGHLTRLRSGWAWAGGALALLMFTPHLIWQILHDWPTLEFMENAKRYKIADQTPLSYFLGQLLINHPANAVLWLTGLAYALARRELRWLGVTYLVAFAVFAIQQSKVYYLSAITTAFFGVGAVALVRFAARPRLRWLAPAQVTIMLVTGLATMPLAVPLLPPGDLARYQRALGLAPRNAETSAIGELDQHFADRFGWPELAQAVARAYHDLTPQQQAACVIVASNYGEAGAINYFGPALGLPRAISGHNSYAYWPVEGRSGEVAILVGYDLEEVSEAYATVRAAARLDTPFAMPFERGLIIYVGENPRISLAELVARIRFFI